ncbi:MAG: L,D-transpeptidase family protein, partial [Salinisphaeraceae bacterium]|nr:L,D-transpeptidase family protein [Salinisphaeraceae bacterium]
MLQRMDNEAKAAYAEAQAMREVRAREMLAELAEIQAAESKAKAEAAQENEQETQEELEQEDPVDSDDDEDVDDDETAEAEQQGLEEQALTENESSASAIEEQAQLQTMLETLPPIETPLPSLEVLADIEVLLADAYIHLARHRASGVVDPQALNIGWHITRRNVLNEQALYRAVVENKARAYLQSLKPAAPEYLALEMALQRYLALHERGGWRPIPTGGLLKPGEDDDRVPALRIRLQLSGDLATLDGIDGDEDEYEGSIVQAVKRFQQRHGLKVDGIVGPNTIAHLNMTAIQKLDAIRASMERWRWLPADLGQRHIRVNVAGYSMQVIESGKPVLEMPTIVGMPTRRTPNFSETLKYLVANPTWEVPPSIAKKDKLPILKQNLAYLDEHKFDVLSGWGEDEVRVDAATLDWSQFNEEYFPYHLRQQPGPTNALGRIKFMLPNRFNIYLHDTPAKHLFDSDSRTFSSGCIRLKRPLELADYILGNDPRWQGKDIREILEGEPKQILRLKNHIPVHILYFTAWADQESGVVNFREDVYNRDINIIQALNEETSASL